MRREAPCNEKCENEKENEECKARNRFKKRKIQKQ